MNLSVLRAGLALLWLVVGVGLLTRNWWAGDRLDALADGRNLTLFGLAAAALAVWNIVRLWLANRARRRAGPGLREQVTARRRPEGAGEYHAEFDFDGK